MNKAKKLALAAALILSYGCGQHDFSSIFGQQNEDELDDSSSSMNSISYASSSSVTNSIPDEEDLTTNNEEEMKFYELLMQYRAEKGLPRIPISKSLTYIAKIHVRDLYENYLSFDAPCNMHSWSYNDNWTDCCYTPDHAVAKCMWLKPSEMTSYIGYGYEIAHYHSGGATAENSLIGWKGSPGHNAVMVNEGEWENIHWNAVGIGIYKAFATTWFGKEPDECESECDKIRTEFKWCVSESSYGLTVCRELDENLTLSQCIGLSGYGFRPRESPPENCTYL